MVGTKAYGQYVKIDLRENSMDKNMENLEENSEERTNYLDEVEENDQFLSFNHIPSAKSEGHATFRVVYLLAFLLLFILTSLALFCMVQKKLGFNLRDSEFGGVSGSTVLAYGGEKKPLHWQDPPPHKDLAAVARYVMHISEWGSLSTMSTHKGIEGYPFVNVFSVSDGPLENSTGVPYFYFTPMELSIKDIAVENKVSFTVSLAQSDYCHREGFDPEDPRCAHIIFTGIIKELDDGSEEKEFAKEALFSRHEEMHDWPKDHNWFFAKLDIKHIYVLDYFGGAGVVSTDDYFSPTSDPFKDSN